MTMTRETIQLLLDKMTFEVINCEMGKTLAEEIGRALLAALDDLDAVKAELHITERLLRSEAETTLELRAANAAMTEREGVIAYALQDERNTGDCPRVVDIAYNAFMIAKHPNKEDGGPSDWFTDTRPMVMEKIAEIRAALQHKDATHG